MMPSFQQVVRKQTMLASSTSMISAAALASIWTTHS
jgi:3-hydroxyacyl-CoA dehydrogenase